MKSKTHVENMTSSSGQPVPNQFVINTSDGFSFSLTKRLFVT